jgi:membrane AbrB-like protein
MAVAGGNWLMPGPVRNMARPVVGLLAGGAFTPEVMASIGEWWGAIVFVAVYTVVITAIGWVFFRRVCRLDPVTAYFSSTPGGLGELTILGGELGGNVRALVTIHSIRLIVVVSVVPFMLQAITGQSFNRISFAASPDGQAGLLDWLILAACGIASYLISQRVNIVGGVMVIAIFLSAIAHGTGMTHVVPPDWLMAVVQIVIGSVVGARFAGIQWREVRATVLQAFAWTVVLLSTSTAFAWAGAVYFGRPFAAMLLATSPGGMAEMTIISIAIGIETAFVVTCQAFRSIFTVACSPLMFRALGIAPLPRDDGPDSPPRG